MIRPFSMYLPIPILVSSIIMIWESSLSKTKTNTFGSWKEQKSSDAKKLKNEQKNTHGRNPWVFFFCNLCRLNLVFKKLGHFHFVGGGNP